MKSMSETHPTLWIHRTVFHDDVINQVSNAKWIQDNTVDIAEYERLKKELDTLNNLFGIANVSGLKQVYEKGIVEGERQAMKRVKQAIEKVSRKKPYFPIKYVDSQGYHMVRIIDLFKELGLDKEVRS